MGDCLTTLSQFNQSYKNFTNYYKNTHFLFCCYLVDIVSMTYA